MSILDTFWVIFGHFFYLTSINDSLTVELSHLLNWISRNIFELNNILNWILGKPILNQILNESFFWQNSNIELNQIGYRPPLAQNWFGWSRSGSSVVIWARWILDLVWLNFVSHSWSDREGSTINRKRLWNADVSTSVKLSAKLLIHRKIKIVKL